jgi:hypothetical protein
VKLPKKAVLDLATWDSIIRDLETAESAIQNYPRTLAREAQFDFYHGAMMEFKRFKYKFRNRIIHTRDEYDRGQAYSAFTRPSIYENPRITDFRYQKNASKSGRARSGLRWSR